MKTVYVYMIFAMVLDLCSVTYLFCVPSNNPVTRTYVTNPITTKGGGNLELLKALLIYNVILLQALVQ